MNSSVKGDLSRNMQSLLIGFTNYGNRQIDYHTLFGYLLPVFSEFFLFLQLSEAICRGNMSGQYVRAICRSNMSEQ